MDNTEEQLTICVTGPDCGKSSLVVQFLYDDFENSYDPTIEDSHYVDVELDGRKVKVEILDISGNFEYSARFKEWFPRSHGFICVYSLIDRSTYEYALVFPEIIRRIKAEAAGKGKDKNAHVPIVLAGTKLDLAKGKKRKVSTEEGANGASLMEAPHFEVSASTGQNVKETFHEAIREIWKARDTEKKLAALKKKMDAGIDTKKGKSKGKATSTKSLATFTSSSESGDISLDTPKGGSQVVSTPSVDATSTAAESEHDENDPLSSRAGEGYLNKKARYFICSPEDQKLSVFKSAKKATKKASNVFDLSQPHSISKIIGDKKLKYPTIALLPEGSKKPHHLGFDTEEILNKWEITLQVSLFPHMVFGVPIEVLGAKSGGSVPSIVTYCIKNLQAMEALPQVGIYRISAKADDLQAFKHIWNKGETPDPAGFADDHNVFSAGLKLWLRELPDPLLPLNLYHAFINGMKTNFDEAKRVQVLQETVAQMDPIRLATLKILIAHLVQVEALKADNKMTAGNLAIVFGPTCMKSPEEAAGNFNPQALLMDMKFSSLVIELMIKFHEKIFASTT